MLFHTCSKAHGSFFGEVCLKLTWQPPHKTLSPPCMPLPTQSGWQSPSRGLCWIRKDGGIGMTHSCLVSVAKGEMPSLLGCLSNKLAIMGRGLRVNSALLLFSPTLAFDERWLRNSRVLGRRLTVSYPA